MFAQHNKFGITLQVDKKFLDYHLKTAETVAKSAEIAETTVSPEAAARAARMAAAAKKQAKAKQAAAAAAKAKAKAKAKASEKEERCLLAEAVKAAEKAAKAATVAKAAAELVEAAESKSVKPELEPAKEQDGAAAKAAKSEATKAEAAKAIGEAKEAEAAKFGAEAPRPLVQARSAPCRARYTCSHVLVTHAATYLPRSHVSCRHGQALLSTGASGAEEGPDYHGRRRPADARGYPAQGRQKPFWNAA